MTRLEQIECAGAVDAPESRFVFCERHHCHVVMDDSCAFHGLPYSGFVADVTLQEFDASWAIVCIEYVEYPHALAARKQTRNEQVAKIA
jgi:hypothetical protein